MKKTIVIFNNGLIKEYGADFYSQLKNQVDCQLKESGAASTRQWFVDGMFNLNGISAIYVQDDDPTPPATAERKV